jgi:hypothetical protein
MKKHLLPALGLMLVVAGAMSAHAGALSRGGSNFGWYNLSGCNREPYGVVANYHTAKAQIDAALQSLYNAGQRRLRLPIFHGRGLNTGTVMDSSSGNLSPQHRANLTNLLATIRAIGFVELEVSFHPVGAINDPAQWGVFVESYYQENWNLIYNLHPIIQNAGIHYRIDLLNEAIPAPGQDALRDYARRLWIDYTLTFGKNDTLGFSIIPDPARIARMPEVYQGNYPYLLDVHLYGNAYQTFKNVKSQLNSMGINSGWIIGESFYNDAQAAQEINAAINETGQTVYYVAQWPLTRAVRCSDVDVAVPSQFNNWLAQGF